jgi:hypothetical protein
MSYLSDESIFKRCRKGSTHVRTDPVTRATLDIPITRKEVENKGSVYGYQFISQSMLDTPRSVAATFGPSAPAQMMRIEALHLSLDLHPNRSRYQRGRSAKRKRERMAGSQQTLQPLRHPVLRHQSQRI